MKKVLLFVVVPILSIVLAVIKIPDVDNWLKEQNSHSALYLGIFIAACTIIIHFINVISPFKKFEKIEKNKWAMMQLVINSYQDNYFKKNKLSANVMIIKRCFFNTRQPHKTKKDKISKMFFQRIFKVVWAYDNKPIDKRLILTIKQGSSGIAFNVGKPVLIDIKNDGDGELNLTEAQKSAIPNLEFIISCPIFSLDERYGTFSSKIIGILNVSCSYPKSRYLIEKSEDRIILTDKVMDFSKICSLIM